MEIIFKKLELQKAQQSLNVILGQIGNVKAPYEKVQHYERNLPLLINQLNSAWAEICRLRGILNARGFA